MNRCDNFSRILVVLVVFVAHWAKHNPDKTDPDKIVCTDCHGDHRMKVRTIIWDKKTRNLLGTNRGE